MPMPTLASFFSLLPTPPLYLRLSLARSPAEDKHAQAERDSIFAEFSINGSLPLPTCVIGSMIRIIERLSCLKDLTTGRRLLITVE